MQLSLLDLTGSPTPAGSPMPTQGGGGRHLTAGCILELGEGELSTQRSSAWTPR